MTDKKLTLLGLEKRVRALEDLILKLPNMDTEFDYQKAQYCDACRKNVPQIIANIHSHVVHGL